jgi:ribosome biogenesis GTPase
MEVLVYKSTGSWYVVKDALGNAYNARAKGIFKIDGITSTNPIAVGDTVTVEMENELEKTVTITEIIARNNYIARVSPHNKHLHHIIASNLSQTLLFATLKDPKTSNGFIDRFLLSAEAYHIPAVIVFNKADLYKKKELVLYETYKNIYEQCGYKVLKCSMHTGEGVDAVKQLLLNNKTLLSGHSGVGKSTFINHIFPKLSLRTSEVSGWSGKGLHTTTFAEMFDLPTGGKIIDTPGIRELGLVAIAKTELAHYFPEMRRIMQDCQFNNCMHINEPNCAVKIGLEVGLISVERYASYLTILDTIDDKKY